jgi:hypothetical protein
MKTPRSILLGLALLTTVAAKAQLNVPVADVTLANPSAPPLTVRLGHTDRQILPTPFVLHGSPALARSPVWVCMDPLQTIYYRQSGQPAGAQLHYASDSPAQYDRWTPLAPGLNAARLQNLADLFQAYLPSHPTGLVASALQLAVPEITNEFDAYSFSLTTGMFRTWGSTAAANSVISLAQSMLASLNDVGIRGRGDVRSLRFLIDGTYRRGCSTELVQDLVGFVPVPEPSTYAAGAAGLLLLLIGARAGRRPTARPADASAT